MSSFLNFYRNKNSYKVLRTTTSSKGYSQISFSFPLRIYKEKKSQLHIHSGTNTIPTYFFSKILISFVLYYGFSVNFSSTFSEWRTSFSQKQLLTFTDTSYICTFVKIHVSESKWEQQDYIKVSSLTVAGGRWRRQVLKGRNCLCTYECHSTLFKLIIHRGVFPAEQYAGLQPEIMLKGAWN